MLNKLAIICAVFVLAMASPHFEAEAGGTRNLAIPTGVCASASGEFVGLVGVDVTAGWLNAPHSIIVTVTSNNGVPDEPHGTQTVLLSTTTINTGPEQGVVEVIIDWGTTDMNSSTLDHVYEVCAQLIHADQTLSREVCVGGFRFSDCD